MKQFTTLKLLSFVTLSIATFPAFTMENKSTNKRTGQNKSLQPNKYMIYNRLLKLSKKPGDDSKKYTYEVICYNVNGANNWVCPNLLDKDLTKAVIENTKLFAKTAAKYIAETNMKNYMKKEGLDKPDYDKTNLCLITIEKLKKDAMKEWIKSLSDGLYNKRLRTVFHIAKKRN